MDWLEGKRLSMQESGRLRLAYIALITLGLLVALSGSLFNIEPVSILLATLSALSIFAGLSFVLVDLPAKWQDRLDFRGNWVASKRRWLAGWILLAWIIVLQVLQNVLPYTLLGTLVILVSLILWRLVVLTSLERSLDIAQSKVESDWPSVDEVESTEEIPSEN